MQVDHTINLQACHHVHYLFGAALFDARGVGWQDSAEGM